jgi:hypothetical protein
MGRDHLKEPGVDGTILKCILRKQVGLHSSGSEQSPGMRSCLHSSNFLGSIIGTCQLLKDSEPQFIMKNERKENEHRESALDNNLSTNNCEDIVPSILN